MLGTDLEQRDLVILREHGEAGDPLRELDYAADRRREALTEVLQHSIRALHMLGHGVEGTGLEHGQTGEA
jgi:hypothetical protein